MWNNQQQQHMEICSGPAAALPKGLMDWCPSRERVLESKSQAQFHLTLYPAPVQSFTNNLNKDEGDISYLLMTQIWEAQ
jgi:hypothetical protein